ncbi:hypothetical protein [uncultured Cellulomonas sp.]|uniref:SRPBCC family protein n=1 Tax=uncultured Cellulomonas sp. TaxID=189682 RepID=UPI0028E4A904|nr:hypothetical protein [uncultured Cellulomonas sp.]
MTLELREVVSVEIPVPPDTVWSYLRDPALVRRWYGWDHDGLEAEIRRIFVDQAVEHSEGTGDETVRILSWPHHDRLTLRSSAHDRSRVSITRSSHQGMAAFDGVRDEVDEGWIAFLHQLQFALSIHPDQDRRTLSVFGLAAGARTDRLLDRAGLRGIHGVPVGGHVQARRPDGTLLGGTLIYRAPLQFGLRLHGITESFLVVMETPAAIAPPEGTVDAILSTYGLDDATLAEVQRRWSGWWQQSVPHSGSARVS